MAHTCPQCGQYCTCDGDWDDIDFGIKSDCRCCIDEEDDDEDWEDVDDEWDDEVEAAFNYSINKKINDEQKTGKQE
jgi:hypothetical protein